MHELNEEVKHISNPDGYVDYTYSACAMINEEYYGTLAEDSNQNLRTTEETMDDEIETIDFVEPIFPTR